MVLFKVMNRFEVNFLFHMRYFMMMMMFVVILVFVMPPREFLEVPMLVLVMVIIFVVVRIILMVKLMSEVVILFVITTMSFVVELMVAEMMSNGSFRLMLAIVMYDGSFKLMLVVVMCDRSVRLMQTCMSTMLLNVMIDILIAIVFRVHNPLVRLLYLLRLTLMLQDSSTLLSQRLLLLLVQLPGLFFGVRGEERLDLVVMVVQLELLFAHVGVPRPELRKFGVRVPLLFLDVALLLGQGLLVLPAAIVGLGSLKELLLLMMVLINAVMVRPSVVVCCAVSSSSWVVQMMLIMVIHLLFLVKVMLVPVFHLLEVFLCALVLQFSLILALFELEVALVGQRLHVRQIIILIIIIIIIFLVLSVVVVGAVVMLVLHLRLLLLVKLLLFVPEGHFALVLPGFVGALLLPEIVTVMVGVISPKMLLILLPVSL